MIRLLHILDRLRHVRSRADDLAALRRRLGCRSGRRPVTAQEASDATELRRLRETMSAALGRCDCCATCARGYPPPHGRFEGGYCCGGGTDNVYSSDEIAALRLSGTRPHHLFAPQGDHAGCVFRGPRGCSLPPAHRPNICVYFLCSALTRELAARGELDQIEALCEQMHSLLRRFMADRTTRLADEALEEYV